MAAVIGLTRVYLRAHYWSDVVGGWALGAGVFGAVAALALLISYIRQNGAAGWTCRIPEALRSSSPCRAPLVIAAYVGLIVCPRGRPMGAGGSGSRPRFLTLYIFAAMVGIGVAIGLGIIWTYDQWAA